MSMPIYSTNFLLSSDLKLGKFFISDHFSVPMATGNNFSVALLLSLHFISLSFGTDNISAGHSLSGEQTIVSLGGNFELGFFKAGSSSNYYIGIWYKKVSTNTPTVIWVANRDQPVSDKFSSELKIVGRDLVLLNESKTPIWSTELTEVHQQDTVSDSAVAVLLDDGNLVLRDRSKSNRVVDIWQSFDHLTDTWLPGGKLGYNNRTKTKMILFSWKDRDDPAKGLFSVELDPKEKQYIIKWNRSKDYWTSGSWNGKIFSSLPEMQVNDRIYNFSYVENENESYFTYYAYNPSFISRFVMDVSGQVKQLTWLEKTGQWYQFWSQPIQQCQVYGFCGAFGTCSESSSSFCNCLPGFIPRSKNAWNLSEYSGGCMRKTDSQCGDKHGFIKSTGMDLPEEHQSLNVGSEEECKSICSRNCSCVAYAYESNVGCSIWNEQLFNLNPVPQGKKIYIKLASPDLPRERNNNLHIIIVAVSVTSGILVLFTVILLVLRIQQRRSVRKMRMVDGSLTAFSYRDLQIATNNFSHRLGGGGFGSVFKGMLPDATVVAVKKLQSVSQGEKQFRNEVSTIGVIQHVNLVQLRGFCSHGNQKLLVYDYMPYGSLDLYLFHGKKDKVLDWKTRYQIALGTARGLVYLHEKCRDCIIHCDIKPENILLDSQLRPKVADFGLAKLVGRDFSRVLTTMRGTRGYLAPEWLAGIAITAKADVYSYGMMLFELVSGRRNMNQYEDGSSNFFPSWAANVTIRGGDVLDLLDPRLDRVASVEEVTRMCRLACWCIQDGEENRPSMSLVVQILEGVSDVNPNPQLPRCLQLFAHNPEHTFLFTESYSSQSTQVDGNTSNSCSQSI